MNVMLAAELEQMGDHLLGMGTSWGDKGFRLALLIIVIVTLMRKFSFKAGLGALIGLVLCLGIYNSRTELSGFFKNEITSVDSTPQGLGEPGAIRPDRAGGLS
ncbi:hypothetical protein SLUN_00160 [Streptomyces lunaelactis]|uniref:Uncharacterized protein n=1 Tax=Streptomyces lunaelactis TaxID=1535768 RepID=A0A2R4SVL1_9ACTN|nr:hypothetical protein [Streptomyces lunaelactis]AVZ70917.1 hypothetical protein SLUN_00160 [Streptomyces lunaelactis]NUK25173.1 hypothetical protein [Streptomyces lunaelactis]NUK85616.1 hypothetical protein [Streptomyces lunaelactis]